ncbi:hypothetical protein BH10ACT9_BH10ACT9_24120 [soil metagenome]
MHPSTSESNSGNKLKKNVLGVPSIFFYVIAAASPFTVVVGLFPIIIGLGNGIGAAGSFVLAAAVLLVFAVGYVSMSRHITNAGAFYAYVTAGLGRECGLGSAFLTMFSYTAIQAALFGGFGFYLNSLLNTSFGIDPPWWLLALGGLVLCTVLGVQGVHSGVLATRPPGSGDQSVTYTYDLTDPVPTVGGNTFITSDVPPGPLDQRAVESRSDVVSFTSAVLEDDLEVGGRVLAVLHADSSARAVDWVVRLCDVHPDGRSLNVCDGILRTAGGGPHRIDLWSTSMVFLAGHRLRVDVTNSSFPRWDRAPADGEYRTERARLLVDAAHPSRLVLPAR